MDNDVKVGQIWKSKTSNLKFKVVEVNPENFSYRSEMTNGGWSTHPTSCVWPIWIAVKSTYTLVSTEVGPVKVGQVWKSEDLSTTFVVLEVRDNGFCVLYKEIDGVTLGIEVDEAGWYHNDDWTVHKNYYTLVSLKEESGKPCPACGTRGSYFFGVFGHNCSAPGCVHFN